MIFRRLLRSATYELDTSKTPCSVRTDKDRAL